MQHRNSVCIFKNDACWYCVCQQSSDDVFYFVYMPILQCRHVQLISRDQLGPADFMRAKIESSPHFPIIFEYPTSTTNINHWCLGHIHSLSLSPSLSLHRPLREFSILLNANIRTYCTHQFDININCFLFASNPPTSTNHVRVSGAWPWMSMPQLKSCHASQFVIGLL